MKVIERSSDQGWGNRLNIIDENNVFVGFDYDSCCCENFGHYFTKEEPLKVGYENEPEEFSFNHEDYVFDTEYIKEDLELDEYDDGGAVAFRLINKDGAEVFLVLYNHHNGYYSHGFEFKIGEDVKHEGSL